jgi:mannose-1-phosphate guanylyltransferase
VLRFVEKPKPHEITTDTINAGIYVIETKAIELMPAGVNHSIERGFFPALLARGDRVLGAVHRGYWIDIGTPQKYLQVHRDILQRRFPVALEAEAVRGGFVAAGARVAEEAELKAPFFVGAGSEVQAGACLGPDAVLVGEVRVERGAVVRDSVLWPGCEVGGDARVEASLLGRGVRIARHAQLRGALLGEDTLVSEHSRSPWEDAR